MKKPVSFAAILLLSPALLLAQWPVIDEASIIQFGQQVLVSRDILTSLKAQGIWMSQVYVSKLPWGTKLPGSPLNSTIQNTIGEMIAWGPALRTGYGANIAWRTATAQLSPQLAGLVIHNFQAGSAPVAQLATIEAINGAGANNLAIIGQARSYLSTSLPAIQGLQNQVLDPNVASNGPTQQMQLTSMGIAQANSTGVQNLQVATGTLEALTAISKGVGDAGTADLNIQAKQQATYQSESALPGGWAQAFANHQ